MTKAAKNPKVEAYFNKAKTWSQELKKLREIILDCELTEELKWGKPCYDFQGSNIVILLPLKQHCVLLFCNGALLKDPKGILIKPGENTQAARQARFTGLREIVEMESTLKAYIHEAIEAEKAGLKVEFKKITDFEIPEELQKAFDDRPALETAFKTLTPGRQRAYLMHFAAPKQSKTRESRIEKCMPQILKGKGLND